MADSFRDALARLEQALAGALETVTAVGTPTEIEELVRLLIKREIVTEMLLDKINILSTDGSFKQSDTVKVIESSNQLRKWDELMLPANNGTNAELETTKKYERFFL